MVLDWQNGPICYHEDEGWQRRQYDLQEYVVVVEIDACFSIDYYHVTGTAHTFHFGVPNYLLLEMINFFSTIFFSCFPLRTLG